MGTAARGVSEGGRWRHCTSQPTTSPSPFSLSPQSTFPLLHSFSAFCLPEHPLPQHQSRLLHHRCGPSASADRAQDGRKAASGPQAGHFLLLLLSREKALSLPSSSPWLRAGSILHLEWTAATSQLGVFQEMVGSGPGCMAAVPGLPCKAGQWDPPSSKVTSARRWSPLAERIHLAETLRRGRTGVQGVPLHPQWPGSIRLKEREGSGCSAPLRHGGAQAPPEFVAHVP